MKKMKTTTNSSKKDVSYSFIDECLVIDGVSIRPAEGICNRNLTDKHFMNISCRDRSIERLLMIAASMLVDYHYHHPRLDLYPLADGSDGTSDYDDAPHESEKLLHEVHTCCRVIFGRVLQRDWRQMTGYISLAMALLYDVIDSLHDFNIALSFHEELIGMVTVTEGMKELTDIAVPQPRAEFVYSSSIDVSMVNDRYPKYNLRWKSCNYRDSLLFTIKNRDLSLEFRLKYVNSMLMEYHNHRYYMDSWDNTYEYVYDENPEQSKTVLLRARDYIDVVIEHMFTTGQKYDREYYFLAVSLMLEVYGELRNYQVYVNPSEKLDSLQMAILGRQKKKGPKPLVY